MCTMSNFSSVGSSSQCIQNSARLSSGIPYTAKSISLLGRLSPGHGSQTAQAALRQTAGPVPQADYKVLPSSHLSQSLCILSRSCPRSGRDRCKRGGNLHKSQQHRHALAAVRHPAGWLFFRFVLGCIIRSRPGGIWCSVWRLNLGSGRTQRKLYVPLYLCKLIYTLKCFRPSRFCQYG